MVTRRDFLKGMLGAAATPVLGCLPARVPLVVATVAPVVSPPVLAPFSVPELWILANKIKDPIKHAKAMNTCGLFGLMKFKDHPLYKDALDAQRESLFKLGHIIRRHRDYPHNPFPQKYLNDSRFTHGADLTKEQLQAVLDTFMHRGPIHEVEQIVGMKIPFDDPRSNKACPCSKCST